jgi:hypothetical protein
VLGVAQPQCAGDGVEDLRRHVPPVALFQTRVVRRRHPGQLRQLLDQAEFRRNAPAWAGDEVRPYLAAHAHLLGSFTEFHRLGSFQRLTLSWRIFGRDRVSGEITRVRAVLAEWGYRLGQDDDTLLPMVVCQLFLLNRNPHLEDLSTELFDRVRRDRLLEGARLNTLFALQRAVSALGICDPPRHRTGDHSAKATGGTPVWEQWVDRWHTTSTLTPRTRGNVRSSLLKVGRWLAAEHPEAADPVAWTRQTCAAWVAALDRMNVGDYVQRTSGLKDRVGKPLEASSKDGQLSAIRRFFADCQEWEWLPRRFDPQRALATPRSVTALLGPNPRVIADEICRIRTGPPDCHGLRSSRRCVALAAVTSRAEPPPSPRR